MNNQFPTDDDDPHADHGQHDDHHLLGPGHTTHDHLDWPSPEAGHDGHDGHDFYDALHDHSAGTHGDHAEEIGHWHEQHDDHGAGIAAQEFILAGHADAQHSEAELLEIAADHGWFVPGGGTPLYDAGSLLEHFGVQVEQRHYGRLEDLELALAEGMDVIVALTAADPDPSLELGYFSGIPGQEVSRAVQVIGVDRTDLAFPAVLVNDPSTPAGAGQSLQLTDFLDSWADSDNFMVLAEGLDDD